MRESSLHHDEIERRILITNGSEAVGAVAAAGAAAVVGYAAAIADLGVMAAAIGGAAAATGAAMAATGDAEATIEAYLSRLLWWGL